MADSQKKSFVTCGNLRIVVKIRIFCCDQNRFRRSDCLCQEYLAIIVKGKERISSVHGC